MAPATTLVAGKRLENIPKPDVQSIDAIESELRARVFAARIRISGLFSDFDKLRSGFVTLAQFRRCLGSIMDRGVVSPLSESECDTLARYYDVKGDGTVKWTAFVDSIDKVFGAKRLDQNPTQYIVCKSEPVRPPLSPHSQGVLHEIIERLRSYCKHHGCDVKSFFTDFDKHHNGYVTYNQMLRGIPANLLSMEEEELLISHYSDQVLEECNYFKLVNDVNRKTRRYRPDHAQLVARSGVDNSEHIPVGTEEIFTEKHEHQGKVTADFVESEIKKKVYKERIRIQDFFRDFDRLHCGNITEAQFRSGLKLSAIPLEQDDIAALLSRYSDAQGIVAYYKFCSSIDTVFTNHNIESNPLLEVSPPTPEFLSKGCGELQPEEESRFQLIIARLRALVKERNLNLIPFFKDFDRTLGSTLTNHVTRSHFSRILSTMKLDVCDEDLHILVKKYEDLGRNKVNYMHFVRHIDPESYRQPIQRKCSGASKSPTFPNATMAMNSVSSSPTTTSKFNALFARMEQQVALKRIRVCDSFKDFDKLRSGCIPRDEFIRGINALGLDFSEDEYEFLADHYADKMRIGSCRWKKFEDDIESAFMNNDLESKPTAPPKVAVSAAAHNYNKVQPVSEDEEKLINKLLAQMKSHFTLRHDLSILTFRDFDKLRTNYVSQTQFRQVLDALKVRVTDAEFATLCKRFEGSDAQRVSYVAFSKALQQL
ncbi:hypothetical protein SeMB42_g00541 [Synchytrium endobioticum]|uniref:EF-hand domain-containing protein n=1 Tax=Synchytrium endobioticum TaxID=286115 RepID=A0A507DGP2_9FUNG|nr:hypothetical protein SeLEV6574_g01178 [Synchytrium endobioticum]TPX53904.1 hypothetical protein SeMB42_g00541 [Synchytrium endobioticum]